jgi:two-component system, chemotaxis family, sensor kinase CheA
VGTTVSLRVPLSLSILDGFLVKVGADTFIVPLENVHGCIELPEEQRNSGASGLLNLRGHALPYLRLRDHFATEDERPARESVVVIEDASGRAGIAVDELLGHAQCVIKPLGKLFQRVSGISGSAILGNGRVALILDIAALLQQVLRNSAAAATQASTSTSH